jgi:general secretion pathway protein F
MAIYEYQGVGSNGRVVKGIVDAESPKAARAKLRKQDLFITQLVEEKEVAGKGISLRREVDFRQIFGRVKSQEVSVFTRQLATLLNAGLPLVEALNAIIDQLENVRLKKIVTQVREKVNEGSSLADGLKGSPNIFSDLYVNMVRAGESSGALDIVLVRLSDFLEDQVKLRQKVTATLVYPIFMVIFMGLIVFFLMTFVLPKVTEVFANMGQAVPIYTRIMIGLSHFFQKFWWLLIALWVGLYFGFRRALHVPKFRRRWDVFRIRAPIFGKISRKIAISRFTRTLSTLLSSGIPVLISMDIVKNVVENTVLSEAIDAAKNSISEGSSIAEPLRRSGLFPPIVTHMITVGEKSGELESMLVKVSEAYDNEVEATVSGLTALLEPVLILMMGGIVFFIMISVLLPILQMNQVLK